MFNIKDGKIGPAASPLIGARPGTTLNWTGR